MSANPWISCKQLNGFECLVLFGIAFDAICCLLKMWSCALLSKEFEGIISNFFAHFCCVYFDDVRDMIGF